MNKFEQLWSDITEFTKKHSGTISGIDFDEDELWDIAAELREAFHESINQLVNERIWKERPSSKDLSKKL